MPNPPGSFIWYELMTDDVDGAKRFYDAVAGWSVEAEAANPMDYRMINTASGQVGGVMRIDDRMKAGGARPCWLGYIAVDDVDSAAERAQAAGASVHVPPTDIPDVGRFAMLADPQGAPFYVMRGISDQSSNAFAPETVGHCCWNELKTSDLQGAKDFYLPLFGWTLGEVMPMGELGDYQFIEHAGEAIGAMMNLPPGRSRSGWTFCFRVEDVDEAHRKVSAAGGTPLEEPAQVPGDMWVFEAQDPEGVHVYFGGPRKR